MTEFDPLHQWLGIPPDEQPPNHYRLLGLRVGESDLDVISNAADQRIAHIRKHQIGPHSSASQELLNDLSSARLCLMHPERKEQYDASLHDANEEPPTLQPLEELEPYATLHPAEPPRARQLAIPMAVWVGGAVFAAVALIGTFASIWFNEETDQPPRQVAETERSSETKTRLRKQPSKSDIETPKTVPSQPEQNRQKPPRRPTGPLTPLPDKGKTTANKSQNTKQPAGPVRKPEVVVEIPPKQSNTTSSSDSKPKPKPVVEPIEKRLPRPNLAMKPANTRIFEIHDQDHKQWSAAGLRDPLPATASDEIRIEPGENGAVTLTKVRGSIISAHLYHKRVLQGDFTIRVVIAAPSYAGMTGGGTAIPYVGFRALPPNGAANRGQPITVSVHASLRQSGDQLQVYEIARRNGTFTAFIDGRRVQITGQENNLPGHFFLHMNEQAQCTIVDFRILKRDNLRRLGRLPNFNPRAKPLNARQEANLTALKKTAYLSPRSGIPIDVRFRYREYRSEHLDLIRQLPTIQSVNLSKVTVKIQDLEQLQKLDTLRFVGLNKTQLRDDDLAYLLPMKKLETLDLSENALTDEVIGYFYEFPNLMLVNLRDTKVSDAAIERLRQELPNCVVIPPNS